MRNLFALALIAALAVTTVADDKTPNDKVPNDKALKKNAGERSGRNPMVAKLTKSLEDTNLSEDQKSKIQAAKTAFATQAKQLRESGLTPELMKKRAEAMKTARQSGLQGKEMRAKINESLTADERALFEKMNKATGELQKTVAKTLTKEQLAALPDAVRKPLENAGKDKPRKGNRKGKKKQGAI